MSSNTNNTNIRNMSIRLSGLWFGGWLFTIGYADLNFWRGLAALFIWPYFVGGRVQ